LGCAAWGTVTLGDGSRRRYRNTPSPNAYLGCDWGSFDAWPDRSGALVTEVEKLDAPTLLRERIMLGLRLHDGLDVEACAVALGTEPWPAERTRARDRLLASGQLEHAGTRFWIPHRHWLFADRIAAELM
jgi:oxygen-independent coproporphyrinogen-3 oxidase